MFWRPGSLPSSFPVAIIGFSSTCDREDRLGRTLKMINSSSLILPTRTSSPIAVRYSWIFWTTSSVASPERIWSRTYLANIEPKISVNKRTTAYWETVFDRVQYSLRFISRPLTSVEVRVPSSTLRAAYFFFCKSSKRWNTPSRSISRSL